MDGLIPELHPEPQSQTHGHGFIQNMVGHAGNRAVGNSEPRPYVGIGLYYPGSTDQSQWGYSHHLRILGELKTDWTLPKTTIQMSNQLYSVSFNIAERNAIQEHEDDTTYSCSPDLDRELFQRDVTFIITWNVYKV